MGFKNKVFGFVAAAALTISLSAGIASANTGSGTGTVNLGDGACAFTLNSGQNLDFNFGTWTWNGPQDKYDAPADSERTGSVSGRLYGKNPTGSECWVQVRTDGLKSGQSTIPGANFRISNTVAGLNANQSQPLPSINKLPVSGKHVGHAFVLRLDSVPNTLVTGGYTGTIEVTVSNSQPGN